MKRVALIMICLMMAACNKPNARSYAGDSAVSKKSPCSIEEVAAYWVEAGQGNSKVWFFSKDTPYVMYYRSADAKIPDQNKVIALWERASKNAGSLKQKSESVAGFAQSVRTFIDAEGNKLSLFVYKIGSLSINDRLSQDAKLPPEVDAKLRQMTTIQFNAEGQLSDEFSCIRSYFPMTGRHYLLMSGMKQRDAAYHMRRVAK